MRYWDNSYELIQSFIQIDWTSTCEDQTKLISSFLPVVGLAWRQNQLQMNSKWSCLGSKRHRQRSRGVGGSSLPCECGRQNVLQGRTHVKLVCFLHLKEFLVIHYNSIIMNRINIFLAWMIKVLSAIQVQGWEVWDSITPELDTVRKSEFERSHLLKMTNFWRKSYWLILKWLFIV